MGEMPPVEAVEELQRRDQRAFHAELVKLLRVDVSIWMDVSIWRNELHGVAEVAATAHRAADILQLSLVRKARVGPKVHSEQGR